MLDYGPTHPLITDITEVRSLIFSDWDLQIIHSHDETLCCVDYLAKKAQDTNSELLILSIPPTVCLDLMLTDLG